MLEGEEIGTTLTLVDLAGAISLLLWGVNMVQTGIQRAYDAGLRRVLGVALGGRAKAFAAGLAATAVLQSSTATRLMVSSFAAAGLLMFRRGGGTRTRDLGRVLIGLGLMMLALRQLLDLVTPYEDVPRRCQVNGWGAAGGWRLIRFSCGGRDADHLAPDAEGGVACGTVLVSGQAVAAEVEVVVDAAVG